MKFLASLIFFAWVFFTRISVAISADIYLPPNLDSMDISAIPVCYDFGCKQKTTVNLPANEWRTVADWFALPAKTAAEERRQIKQAIGWMEVVIGRHTPTHKDLAFDLPTSGDYQNIFPGQLDCIDEAINTTTYLKLFTNYKLLRHHSVIAPAYRRAIFDQHWAGQIAEKTTGDKFVVDSWFQANGYLPVIQDSESWLDINPLSAVVDNSPDEAGQEIKRSWWHRFLRGE